MPSFAFQNKAKCLVWFDRPSNLSILVWWSWKKKQALCVIYSRHSASSRTGKLPTIKPAQFRMLKTKQQQQQQKKDSPEKGSWGSAYTFWALSLLPSECCCCCYALGVWNEWNGYEPNACQLLCSIATGACERPSHFISLFVFALCLCLFVYLFLFSKYLYIYIYK